VLALKILILIAGYVDENNTGSMQASAQNNAQSLESLLTNKKPPGGGFLLAGVRPDEVAC
jgi:hypothetical protein